MSIKTLGDDFEDALVEMTSAEKYDRNNDPRGDACFSYKGKEYSLEAKDKTLNQVRADKDAVLLSRKEGLHYGASNRTILETIVRGGFKSNNYEKKGQHTPDPLTCAGMGDPSSAVAKRRGMRCFGDKITDKDIINLIEENLKYPEISDLFSRHKKETTALAKKFIDEAREILEKIES